MSNLYKSDEDINVACSPFAIYPNEEIVSEIRKSDFKFSWIKPDEIKAIDVELIYAIYILQYSTSRQLTQYLNLIRGIDIPQREVTRLVTKYNKQLISSRFAFKSDIQSEVTNLKVYALAKNGNIILKSRPLNCSWKVSDSCILEDIKKYLARNQFLLKVSNELSLDKFEWKTNIIGVSSNFIINDIRFHVIPVRREFDFLTKFSYSLDCLLNHSSYLDSDKIVIIAEDDKHAYEIFKHLIMNKCYTPNILLTQDNRLITTPLNSCFIKFKIYKANGKTKVELETGGYA